MDPRHRDKVAFVRVVSGRFERGMKVTNARTKKSVALSRPSQLFGQDKTVLDEGFAGDVIGLNNPGSFAIGDTLYVGKRRALPPIPTFSPSCSRICATRTRGSTSSSKRASPNS